MNAYTKFFRTADGVRVAYAMRGQGLPPIYLPPFVSHLELMWEAPAFRTFNEALARDFTPVRYDRYGCGLSDRERTDFDLDVDLHILDALVDHLRFRRFALLGVSDGGPVAIRYAVEHPRRVSHLLLFGVEWRGRMSRVGAALNQLMLADWRLGTNAFADDTRSTSTPSSACAVAPRPRSTPCGALCPCPPPLHNSRYCLPRTRRPGSFGVGFRPPGLGKQGGNPRCRRCRNSPYSNLSAGKAHPRFQWRVST